MSTGEQFCQLVKDAQECRICTRMSASERVVSYASGPIDSSLMFIGEAPGRLGAERTSIPFHGDKAGQNFEAFINQVGLTRYDFFVTNAVLCNPRNHLGNNDSPQPEEIRNCSTFLKRQIDLINPQVVVTLGARALHAISLIEPHNCSLSQNVRSLSHWYNRQLIPLYHPGQRALIHRSFANQLSDYQFVAEVFRRLSHSKRRAYNATPKEKVKDVVLEILCLCEGLSYFALHKLYYLAEYEWHRAYGSRLTDAYIIRQKDGPYCTDLHTKYLQVYLPKSALVTRQGRLFVRLPRQMEFGERETTLNDSERETIHYVVQRYSSLTEPRLKTAVYLTSPMRSILLQEKRERINNFNAPISF